MEGVPQPDPSGTYDHHDYQKPYKSWDDPLQVGAHLENNGISTTNLNWWVYRISKPSTVTVHPKTVTGLRGPTVGAPVLHLKKHLPVPPSVPPSRESCERASPSRESWESLMMQLDLWSWWGAVGFWRGAFRLGDDKRKTQLYGDSKISQHQ